MADHIPTNPAELQKLSEKDPEYAEAQESLGELGLPEDNLEAVQFLRELSALTPLPAGIPEVVERELAIPTSSSHQLRLLVFAPATTPPDQKLPLLLLYHGGGYTLGRPENVMATARDLVQHLGIVVAAPSYRLAPEHPFPQGWDDAWDAFCWTAANAASVESRVSTEKGFLVGGISAGANFTNYVVHKARDEQIKPAITGVFSCCGSNCHPDFVAEENKERYLSRFDPECSSDFPLSKRMLDMFWECSKLDPASPLVSSLLWPTGHKGLPRTYFQVCGREYSRDEALVYATTLRDLGVDVKVDIYPGLPHCWWSYYPALKATVKWRQDTRQGLAWLLSDSSRLP